MDNLQQIFFQEIKQTMPGHLSMVDEVANLLNISTDSAYRRIRNEKALSLEETSILAGHFKISIDLLFNLQTGTGSFSGSYVSPENFDFTSYLERIYQVLDNIYSCNEKELVYYCKDFPLFYYFAFPELAAFKYFIWMKTSLNFPAFANVPFSFEYFMKPFIEIGQKIFARYAGIPGTEIMNVENVLTTLLQIEYYKNSFLFSTDDVVSRLLDKFEDMTKHLLRQAEEGVKFIPSKGPNGQSPKYNLYVNDFVIGDNQVIALCNGNITSFITHSHINFITIADKKFTAYHHAFVKNIMRKSILISETGEKYRARFFHLVQGKIDQCRNNKLETMG